MLLNVIFGLSRCVVNGDVEQVDFIDNSITEEEEERCLPVSENPQVRKTNCAHISKSFQDESVYIVYCIFAYNDI